MSHKSVLNRLSVPARRFIVSLSILALGWVLLLSVGARPGGAHGDSARGAGGEGLKAAGKTWASLGAAPDSAALTNSPPVAVDDSYTVHRSLQTYANASPYGVLYNDYDPDGNYFYCQEKYTPTAHGWAYVTYTGVVTYTPNNGFTGTETVPYTVCDTSGACSTATMTFNVVNQAPTVVNDSYDVHRSLQTNVFWPPYGVLRNDSDPDGDPITSQERNYVITAHGNASLNYQGNLTYNANSGYVGTDSMTYRVCDNLGACSDGNITFNVVNQAPVVLDDIYAIRRADIIRGNGNFDTAFNLPPNGAKLNDFDPEGDNTAIVQKDYVRTAHGYVSVWYDGRVQYSPDNGFVGTDSTTYTLCDSLNACSTGNIWFFVLEKGENNGASPCASVGNPVNVTNGNMYLQQADYGVPGVGGGLEVVRTFNSDYQRAGLFGKGWTTAYDESLTVYDSNMLRLDLPDGRAIYLGRAGGGSFNPLTPDFRGQVTQNAGGYALTFKNGRVHQFSASGKLLSGADRNNNQTTLTYDASGKLSQVTDPFGRVLNLTTDANGRVTSLSDGSGVVATYTYGADGALQAVVYPDGSRFDFTYTLLSPRVLLTSVTDALGHVVEAHAYDGLGRAATSEVSSGVERYTLSFVGSNQTDVTDALGNVTKYFFDDSKGRNVVTRTEGPCGCGSASVQTRTYDGRLNVLTETNGLNQTTSYTYDAGGNRLTKVDVLGTTRYAYNGFGDVLTVTDPMNGVTTNTYDERGNLLTAKDALNNTATFTYDARGQMLTAKDARNNVTTFTWDANGQLTEVKDAANHVTAFARDARGRVTAVTNALNEVTNYEYDAVGRSKKVIYPDSSYVEFTYDLAGRRTKVKDARGYETAFAYDAADRLTGITNADNKTTLFSYDLMSNLTSHTDASNRTTNYEYDGSRRLVKTIYPPATPGAARLETRVEYDAGGNVKKQVDTMGRETVYDYDAANRLVKVTDPTLRITQYEYNARSQTTAIVDAINQRYTFAYDPLGRVTQVTRGGISMSYSYDAVGNRTGRTDYNNATTSYAYDSLNRPTTITYPDTTTVSYAYDQLSRLSSATNANGTVSFSYDNRGRLSATTDVFAQTVGYAYDANGNRTALSLGQAASATYQYDALNRLTQITDGANANTGYAYDATDKLTTRTLPNGVTGSYQYDGLDRLTRLTNARGAATLTDAQYQYNFIGRITQVAEPASTRNFGYDSADRLSSVQNPTQAVESYAYDAVGNRTASHQSSSFSYQPFNKVVAIGPNSYSYDNNGNLTQKVDPSGTWTYAWDFENRLTQVTRPDGQAISYKYDALGRRVQRTKGSQWAKYVYDGDDVVKDLNSDGGAVEYLNGPGIDNKISQSSGSGRLYFLTDHLGSTRALADSNGDLVESIDYDSFGNGASSLTRYGFTGREWDADANLYYYRNRWYDAQAGRFISEDPIGLNGGMNMYAYVGNDPTGKTDPLGLYEVDVHFYLTYYLALRTGCFSDMEARRIANGTQGVDEKADTWPAYGSTERQKWQNSTYHALRPGSHEGLGSNLLWADATIRNGSYEGLGRHLHYLQDTFSHDGFTDPVWGHSWMGGGTHNSDKTASDVPKAMRMAGATWRALSDFAREMCGCQSKWDDAWWPQIHAFAEIETNYPRSSTIDSKHEWTNLFLPGDPEALERKRQTLGVLPR